MSGNSVLDPVMPATLTVGTGGTAVKRDMVNVNANIAEMTAKSRADTLYDPSPPPPASPGGLVSGFCNYSSNALLVAGSLCLIFAFLVKRKK